MGSAIDARKLFVVHESATGNVVSLQGASLQAEPGELVAVMGPSGSGKSTLLACLAGLQPVTAGELYVYGTRLDEAKPKRLAEHRARTVAAVAQDARKALGDDQSVGARIALRARLAGASRKQARSRARELLARVGLEGRERARRQELSGGEQQRAALCVAIAVEPKLLLVDEVTGQLDANTGRAILELLAEVAAQDHTTVLLATHDPRAADVATRVVTIRDGRLTGELHGDKRPPVRVRGRRRPAPARPRRPARGGDRSSSRGRDRPRRGRPARRGRAEAARRRTAARPDGQRRGAGAPRARPPPLPHEGGDRRRRRQRHARAEDRRLPRPGRPVRLREDDAAAPDRRPRPRRSRHGHDRRHAAAHARPRQASPSSAPSTSRSSRRSPR